MITFSRLRKNFIRGMIVSLALLAPFSHAQASDEPPPEKRPTPTPITPSALLTLRGEANSSFAAWDSLPPAQKVILLPYLEITKTVMRIDEMPIPRGGPTSEVSDEICKERRATRIGYNILGWEQNRYVLRVKWCYQDGIITASRHTRTATTRMALWEFVGHIDQSISGGEGRTWYEVYSQGHFRICFVEGWCPAHYYPWVQIEASGDGRSVISNGG